MDSGSAEIAPESTMTAFLESIHGVSNRPPQQNCQPSRTFEPHSSIQWCFPLSSASRSCPAESQWSNLNEYSCNYLTDTRHVSCINFDHDLLAQGLHMALMLLQAKQSSIVPKCHLPIACEPQIFLEQLLQDMTFSFNGFWKR